MLTDTKEGTPHLALRCHWPKELRQRRRFDREAENQPYVEWLRDGFDVGEEDLAENDDDEDDDDGDDDFSGNTDEEDDVDKHGGMSGIRYGKDAGAYDDHDIVRRFMEGTIGEETALPYPDQVERVADFCEQKISGENQKPVAILEDNDGNFISRKGCAMPDQGPLTAQQLRQALSKEVMKFSILDGSGKADAEKRFKIISDRSVPETGFKDVQSSGGTRVV